MNPSAETVCAKFPSRFSTPDTCLNRLHLHNAWDTHDLSSPFEDLSPIFSGAIRKKPQRLADFGFEDENGPVMRFMQISLAVFGSVLLACLPSSATNLVTG